MIQFLKFTILNEKSDQQIGMDEQVILFNVNHIVSIKPINILVSEGEVVKGFWLRTSNGKKYKAVKIPNDLELQLGKLEGTLPLEDEMNREPAYN